MRRWIARFTIVCLLIAALALPVTPQAAPTVTVTPAAGAVERAVFDISIAGLAADSAYTVEILYKGAVVFSSAETSDAAGRIPYPISSTAGDEPGIYTIQVLRDSDVVASADFELTASADQGDDPEGDFAGDVTVSPESAPFGGLQTIRIGELEARGDYTLEITASETLQVVYRRRQTSADDGSIEIEVFAEDGDSPGHHAIAVYDAEGALIAEGQFTIEAPPTRAVSVILTPASLAAGGTVEIAVGGLAAYDSVTAQITAVDDVLIDTVLARASGDGASTLGFITPADLADGDYSVAIFVEGERQASAALRIGPADQPASTARLSISPPSAPSGSEHVIAARGLTAEGDFTLVILDPAGLEESSTDRAADAAGEFNLTLSSTDDDDIGEYRVELRAAESGDLLAAAAFTITVTAPEEAPGPARESAEEPVSRARASITPPAAPIGSRHLVTVRDLAPNEVVTFDVTFAGASVYQSQKTADAKGATQIELYTSDDDAPGEYAITVLRAAGNQPAVILTAQAPGQTIVSSSVAGAVQTISGNLVGGQAEITFEGVAGQYVLITVASDDFDSAGALFTRDDVEIAHNDDSRGQKNAMIGPLQLPYSGEYALAITATPLMMARGADVGNFTVTVESVALSNIALDTDVRFALDAAASALYFALPVATGDSLTITLDSGGALDTLLQMVAPSGTEYAFDDDSGAGFDAELSNLVFDNAATYVLVVSTFEGGGSGEGVIKIRHNPVHSLDSGAAVVTLTDKAIRDLVVFDAQADDYLILNLKVLAGAVEDLYVTAAVEGMEVMSYSTMGVPDALPLAFVMPMSGRVAVTLEKFGYDDGISLEVSLERP